MGVAKDRRVDIGVRRNRDVLFNLRVAVGGAAEGGDVAGDHRVDVGGYLGLVAEAWSRCGGRPDLLVLAESGPGQVPPHRVLLPGRHHIQQSRKHLQDLCLVSLIEQNNVQGTILPDSDEAKNFLIEFSSPADFYRSQKSILDSIYTVYERVFFELLTSL